MKDISNVKVRLKNCSGNVNIYTTAIAFFCQTDLDPLMKIPGSAHGLKHNIVATVR